MKQLDRLPCRKDFRQGADRIHELLEGKVVMPDFLGVVVVGVVGAIVPLWLLIKLWGVM